ncbi:MAG: ATP-binding protein [Bacteroidales bacterium]|nr:ATP-binding protein [Bacteroidales bacterium]
MEKIVGRKSEIALLNRIQNAEKPAFVALYGRRRVGKTFLVNQVFGSSLTFKMTGVIDGTLNDQFLAFADAMEDYGLPLTEKPTDWMSAFILLKKALKPKVERGERCVVFIDELPAMDVQNSGVAKAVGYFWNQWASLQDNFIFVICGSATSWMIDNVIDSKGGLHDRITDELHIRPFCLSEVEEYLVQNGFVWNRQMILQTYMIFGGIPYYLSLLDRGESLVQNVDRLFFGTDSGMRREYKRLFNTLYKNPNGYMNIVAALAKKRYGCTRQELADSLQCSNNGHLGEKIQDLVHCDLVRKMVVQEKKLKKKDALYQLSDFFCVFYLNFIEKSEIENDYWSHHINTPEINTWLGLAFEQVCMEHVLQIKRALRIDGISTIAYSWRSKESTPGAQIDIVLQRADNIINICEVKYSQDAYELTKTEDEKLRNRMLAFKTETGLKHPLWLTLITPEGLKPGMYSSSVQSVVTLDQLFEGDQRV